MKQIKKTSFVAYLFALFLMGMVTGCEKDIYNPDNDKGKLPPAENYFDFKLSGKVNLNVNYNAPGFNTIIEVYLQNPLKEDGKTKIDGIEPIFVAFTDDNGKYEGEMVVPTAVNEIYLYTNRWGLPACLTLEAKDGGFSFDASKITRPETKATTRAAHNPEFIGNAAPYGLEKGNRWDNMYSLCKWDASGYTYYDGFGNPNFYTPNYITYTTKIGNEKIADISARAYNTIQNYEGSKADFLRDAEITNIKVTKAGSVDIVYLMEAAAYQNTLGYYYYKAGTDPGDLSRIKKYIIFPNILGDKPSYDPMRLGATVRLKYFNEDGTSTETFPEGTVIGWFFISNGFHFAFGSIIPEPDQLDYGSRTTNPGSVFFSNDTGNMRRFISLVDTKSKTVILGFEDQTRPDAASEDYSDVLFFVKSDNGELDNEGKPEITDPDNPPTESTATITGTVAFEDIWPKGGDYDLNDVIVEYKRVLTINKSNKVVKAVETFTPVQPAGSALNDNFFACAYKNFGTVKVDAGVILESNTKSFVIQQSARAIPLGSSFEIERTLDGSMTQAEIVEDFNPYIITNEYTTSDRIEVHLPKKDMTDAADKTKMDASNAYYIGENGLYPFAINIPVLGFKPATEKVRIDGAGQYPAFKTWAESKGEQAKDWYLTGKK